MNKLTFSYEFILILSAKLSEEKSHELIKKFQDLINTHGELLNINNWGKKKLAYIINKETEGEYILFTFKSSAEFPKELDRISKITDGILRSMILKQEAEKIQKVKKSKPALKTEAQEEKKIKQIKQVK
jgi:small subunit ribosomal protein S6